MPVGKQVGTWLDGDLYRRMEWHVHYEGISFSSLTKRAVDAEINRLDAMKAGGMPDFPPLPPRKNNGGWFGIQPRVTQPALSIIEAEAKKRGISPSRLASNLLETVAKHNLFLAVLDDAEERKSA